jgi:hypothetical protein
MAYYNLIQIYIYMSNHIKYTLISIPSTLKYVKEIEIPIFLNLEISI